MTRNGRYAPRSGLAQFAQGATVVALTLVAAALLLLGRAEPGAFERLRSSAGAAVAPVLAVLAYPVSWINSGREAVASLASVYDENERLRRENEELLKWQAIALSLENRLARMEGLMRAEPQPDIRFVAGRVVGDSGSSFVHTVLIGVGAADGILPGHAVLAAEGVAGRVIGTGERSARVLLLTDLNSRVPVVIEPGNARAILAGDNTMRPLLANLPPGHTVSVGDRVVTSGDGGVLPAGLPVGRVVAAGPEFRVEPFVARSGIDWVKVALYDFMADVAPEPILAAPPLPPEAPAEPVAQTSAEGQTPAEGQAPAAGQPDPQAQGAPQAQAQPVNPPAPQPAPRRPAEPAALPQAESVAAAPAPAAPEVTPPGTAAPALAAGTP